MKSKTSFKNICMIINCNAIGIKGIKGIKGDATL